MASDRACLGGAHLSKRTDTFISYDQKFLPILLNINAKPSINNSWECSFASSTCFFISFKMLPLADRGHTYALAILYLLTKNGNRSYMSCDCSRPQLLKLGCNGSTNGRDKISIPSR